MVVNALRYGTLVLAGWAMVDAAIRPTPAFAAAGKLTKPGWLAINGIALIVMLVFQLLSVQRLAAIVASVVYLVDVRPALREVQGRGRGW
ncbi:MAG: DUF2516 family protein [Actinobacteria bacterium]|nr:DUF2516 family protein [Actinomycetota bacterium]MBI3688837.1 DUF2516 family protein [Actinomycetota bacterium]